MADMEAALVKHSPMVEVHAAERRRNQRKSSPQIIGADPGGSAGEQGTIVLSGEKYWRAGAAQLCCP